MRFPGFRFAFVRWVLLIGSACGDDDGQPPMVDARPLPPDARPKCGDPLTPLQGDHSVVISDLEIGTAQEGFDLDDDGDPDNKLSAVGNLAGPAIRDALDAFEIIIPIELYDFPTATADECVKFGIYLGHYRQDLDGDGEDTANDSGDCNDLPGAGATINDNQQESCTVGAEMNCGDRRDNDCDGRAEELVVTTVNDAGMPMTTESPSLDPTDMDGDTVSLADGDCDDNNNMVRPGMVEICRDGLDNDCDGNADFGMDTGGMPACTPFDDTPDPVDLDPLSFMGGMPVIAFENGWTHMDGSTLVLEAGPSIFGVTLPITGGINLDLRITGARIVGNVSMAGTSVAVMNGRLGGVLDAYTLDQVRGLDIPEIGLRPEDSFADAMFANILGVILGLQKNEMDCLMPDIDVDRDGHEAFCDTMPDDDIKVIDLCIDGDGTMIADGAEGTVHCTDAMVGGRLRFVDGVSIEMNFAAVPVVLPTELP